MRCDTKQHTFSCGIDRHARTMSVCLLRQEGEVVLHRHMQASPDAVLKTITPYRDDIVIAVAWLVTWYGLADLWAQDGLPFVLGQALSLQASQGGQAKNDPLDSQNIAVLRRGGRLPQASVSPAEMRATRARLRRRMPLLRPRAALLAPLQHTHRQDPRPAIGPTLASTGQRAGVAERCLAPAVRQSIAGDLALIDHDARLRSDVALPRVQTAKPHKAPALSRRQSVPGIGTMVRVVVLEEMPESTRFPRVQDGGSSCRLVTGAKASAGQRDGPAGKKLGHAYLQWALAAAAGLLRRNQAQGQKCLARVENTHGQGKAWTIWAPKWARAVSDLWTRAPVLELDIFCTGYGSRAGEPAASLAPPGISLHYRPWTRSTTLRHGTRKRTEALCSALSRLLGPLRWRLAIR